MLGAFLVIFSIIFAFLFTTTNTKCAKKQPYKKLIEELSGKQTNKICEKANIDQNNKLREKANIDQNNKIREKANIDQDNMSEEQNQNEYKLKSILRTKPTGKTQKSVRFSSVRYVSDSGIVKKEPAFTATSMGKKSKNYM